MTISKKPLIPKLEAYADEIAYEVFLMGVGILLTERFKTGYIKCRAENMGWQKRSGYKVFKCDTDVQDEKELAREFLRQFMPDTDYSATVYSLNNGEGLYFSVSHHDACGESYYLTPISERTYERLR